MMRFNLLLSLLSITLLAGCGDDDPRTDGRIQYPDLPTGVKYDVGTLCGANNCYGCCQGATCITQTSNTACGFGGGKCLPCSSKQTCKGGQCVETTCDSSNCTGCCDTSKTCQNGTTDTVCGTGGAACAACPSTQACLSQKCQLKSTGQYKVYLVSVTPVSSYKCDTFGKCDIYVELTVGQTTAKSTVKEGTDQPVWNESLLIATQADIISKFEAQIWDDDWPVDQDMGYCKPKITTTELTAGKVTSDCGHYYSYGFVKTSVAKFEFKAN